MRTKKHHRNTPLAPRSARTPGVPLQGGLRRSAGRGRQRRLAGELGPGFSARVLLPPPLRSLTGRPAPAALRLRGRALAGPALPGGRGRARVPPPYRSPSLKYESGRPACWRGRRESAARSRCSPEPTEEGLKPRSSSGWRASVSAPTERLRELRGRRPWRHCPPSERRRLPARPRLLSPGREEP